MLAGTHALCGRLADPKVRFLERDDLLDRTKAERVRRALETALVDKLEALERPIPPESIFGMRRDYGELHSREMAASRAIAGTVAAAAEPDSADAVRTAMRRFDTAYRAALR